MSPRRSGFTLIELVIVVGLIAVLAGLATYAVASFVTSARTSRTSTTIKKLNEAIAIRYQHIERYIIRNNKSQTEFHPDYFENDPQLLDLWYDYGPVDTDKSRNRPLAKMIGLKRFYRHRFPQTFAEAGITPPANHDPATENSECLYHFLTSGFSVGDGPSFALSFASYEIADTDNDGLLEVIDAWGNPIRFYRWPTRMIRPQPEGDENQTQDETGAIVDTAQGWFLNYARFNPVVSLGADQEDEFGILIGFRDQGIFTSKQFEDRFHTIETWQAPLIVSAGEDGELGLFEPTNNTEYGFLAQPDFSRDYAMEDDIANWELTTLGVTR